MRVLVACEHSGVIRQEFCFRGHTAWSCDLLPADDDSPYHMQLDCIEAISQKWDLCIAHPPCTHLTISGSRHFAQKQRDGRQSAGIDLFMRIVDACAKHATHWAIENPVGIMSHIYRKPDQLIHPYMFGEDASKATHLWLHSLPKLQRTKMIPPRLVWGMRRWANQDDLGQNTIPGHLGASKTRSRTYRGIARAMATQWGAL